MSTLIKNEGGKLIRNASGNVLKQNYIFGTAWGNPSQSISNYLSFPVNITDDFTFIFWYNDKINAAVPFMGLEFSDGTTAEIRIESNYKRIVWEDEDGMFNFSYIGATTGRGIFMQSLQRENGVLRGGYNDRYWPYTKENHVKTITRIKPFYFSNIVTPKLSTFDSYNFFIRQITQGERSYLFNNKLGNDPQSTNGLIGKYLFDYSKILPVKDGLGGTYQAVAVEDYSGEGNHGEIMGLPAGTLEEQRDWANANLFTSFL